MSDPERPFTIADAREAIAWAIGRQRKLAEHTRWPLKRARHQGCATGFREALDILEALADVPQPQEAEG